MMMQFIFYAVMGAIGYYGYRKFKRDAKAVHEKVRRAEKERQNGAVATLVRDEKTGEYVVEKE
jgi:membrane protein implicated in regulation of membrane protease activity